MSDDSELKESPDPRLSEFIQLCQAWDAVPLTNAAAANVISDKIWYLAEELRQSPEARLWLEDFATNHPSAAVRLKAAVTCLRWAPTIGTNSLEEILAGRGRDYGMLPNLAVALLSSFRAGTLFP
jgi:hypothetical protein